MKALIRGKYETVTEDMEITGIDWSDGYPLTNAKWFGGPYTLIENYVHPKDDEPDPMIEENEDNYVIIDGKRYNKEELRALL